MNVNRFDVNQKKIARLFSRGREEERKRNIAIIFATKQAGSRSAGRRAIQHHLNDSFQYLFNELNENHWNSSNRSNKNGGDTSQQMMMNGNKRSPISHVGRTTTTTFQ